MELPETITLGGPVSAALANRTVTDVLPTDPPASIHFFQRPCVHVPRPLGRSVDHFSRGARYFRGKGDGRRSALSVCDGIHRRFGGTEAPILSKCQMLLTFDDQTFVGFSTNMYGGIYAFRDELDNKYRTLSYKRVSPLDVAFHEAYFERLIAGEKKELSVKALLAARNNEYPAWATASCRIFCIMPLFVLNAKFRCSRMWRKKGCSMR